MNTDAILELKSVRVIFEISLKAYFEQAELFNIFKIIVLQITKINFYSYENLQNLIVFEFQFWIRNTITDIFFIRQGLLSLMELSLTMHNLFLLLYLVSAIMYLYPNESSPHTTIAFKNLPFQLRRQFYNLFGKDTFKTMTLQTENTKKDYPSNKCPY